MMESAIRPVIWASLEIGLGVHQGVGHEAGHGVGRGVGHGVCLVSTSVMTTTKCLKSHYFV